MDIISSIFGAGLVAILVAGIAISLLLRFASIVRYIPNDQVGVVEKLWSLSGSVQKGLLSFDGEAGFQPDMRRGGFHFFFPFQYRVHIIPMISITQGTLGYVFARDGQDLPAGQTLAANANFSDFVNIRDFLKKDGQGNFCGGQKGPQRKVLREGTHILNPVQFVVMTTDATYALALSKEDEQYYLQMRSLLKARNAFNPVIVNESGHDQSEDLLAIVTVHDGLAMPSGELIAIEVGNVRTEPYYHNSFQEPEAFLQAGGCRGKQNQVLVEGTYYINRLFATVEFIPKTIIPVGFVGVVVSYTGPAGVDVSDDNFNHGSLVEKGSRGIWREVLPPGKYAFNSYAGKIQLVPTTNFILKWDSSNNGSKFDENLKEVTLITADAFEPELPLSVVVHIAAKNAPYVIQRFGDIKQLVEQTLDPMVSAYFKNISQSKTLIGLIMGRSDIQKASTDDMKIRFRDYSLELLEVLVGTPQPKVNDDRMENILAQLRDRQIAREQVETFAERQKAAEKERELKEAEQKATQQADVTKSLLSISIKENEGLAQVKTAQRKREEMEALAEGEKVKRTKEGEGNAAAIKLEGEARAAATLAQAKALETAGADKQLMQTVLLRIAEAVEKGKIPIVPQIQLGGGTSANGFETLMGLLSSKEAQALLAGVDKPEAANPLKPK